MKKMCVLFFVLMGFSFTNPKNETNQFVSVKDNHFEISGKPYYFLGTNIWYGANLAALVEGGDRERLVKELDLLQSLGITNIRVLGASEGGNEYNTVKPPFQKELGKYTEKMLIGLDFFLAEMAKRGMYAVIYLNNFWIWSGGMSQYMAWLKGIPVPNPFLPEYSWHNFMNFSAEFYKSEEANKSFRNYIKTLLNRQNTITGKIYKEDPVIMSWQLANEPRPGHGEQGQKNFKVFSKWIDETATYIKSIDPNHLVSTGNEGTAGSLESMELYKEIHSYTSIDYLTLHLWLLNWGWYDPQKAEETYPTAEEKALDYIKKHIEVAIEIGKPIVLEEFGIPRDMHSFDPKSTTKWRDKYFTTIFDNIYQNSKSVGPFAGSNFWTWGGYGVANANDAEYSWSEGDDFTGDPPQEPQGRNSIFANDSTTLKIMAKYGHLMKELP